MTLANEPPKDFNPEAYLACLVAVARADGDASPAERNYVSTQAAWFGKDPETLWNSVDDDKVAEQLSDLSHATAMFILRDCVILGHIDGAYDEDERDHVLALARAMGVREERVIELEKWLDEYFRLVARGEILFTQP
ncbi:MAG: hypothetical protein ACLFOY_00625 [Desulfatibacillaceae bacterium]